MKIIYNILFISILFISNIKASNSCFGKCKSIGEFCDINELSCGVGLNCAYNIDNSTTCQNYIKEKQPCNIINGLSNCDLGLSCIDIIENTFTCEQTDYIQVNEKCTYSNQCTGTLECIENICKLKSGSTCGSDADCDFDEYCNQFHLEESKFSCLKLKFENETCNYNITKECYYGLKCTTTAASPSIGKCLSQRIRDFGDYCDNLSGYDHCDSDKNLYCKYHSGSSNMCYKYSTPNDEKNCNANAKYYCGDFHTCGCDGNCYKSAPNPTETTRLKKNLLQCAYDNGCVLVDNLYSDNSCISKYCRSEICEKKSDDYPVNALSCSNQYQVERYCNSTTKIIYSLLSVLIFIVFLI